MNYRIDNNRIYMTLVKGDMINKTFEEINNFYTDIKDNIDEENFFGESFDSSKVENIVNKLNMADFDIIKETSNQLVSSVFKSQK